MSELQTIKLADLVPSPFNPRKIFDDGLIEELAESVKARGVLEPLIVRKHLTTADKFEIVAGERRFEAAKRAKLGAVPCLVRALSDVEARETQIIENLQREGISPLEEAAGYQELLKASGTLMKVLDPEGSKATVEAIAKIVGKSKRYVYNRLALLNLSQPVQKALASGKIEPSIAQELVPLKPEQQKELLDVAVGTEWDPPMTVKGIRQRVETDYREKTPAEKKREAEEAARRKKFAAKQAKRDAAWKKQQAKSEAERKLQQAAVDEALRLLAPALKKAPRSKLTALVLADALEGRNPAKYCLEETKRELLWGGSPFARAVLKLARIDLAKLVKAERGKAAAAAKAKAAPVTELTIYRRQPAGSADKKVPTSAKPGTVVKKATVKLPPKRTPKPSTIASKKAKARSAARKRKKN